MELSLFGQVHMALDDLTTDKATAFCSGKNVQPADMTEARQTEVFDPANNLSEALQRFSPSLTHLDGLQICLVDGAQKS